jgi:hypothetical protein
MAASPIMASEVEALARQLRFPLTPWMAEVVYKLDDVVLATWAGEAPKPKGRSEPDAAIPVDRPDAIKAMLRGIAAAKAAKLHNRAAKA